MDHWQDVKTKQKIHDIITRLSSSEKLAKEVLGRATDRMAVLKHSAVNNDEDLEHSHCGCQHSERPSRESSSPQRQNMTVYMKTEDAYNPQIPHLPGFMKNQDKYPYSSHRQNVSSSTKTQDANSSHHRQNVSDYTKNQETYSPTYGQNVSNKRKDHQGAHSPVRPNASGLTKNLDVSSSPNESNEQDTHHPGRQYMNSINQDSFLSKQIQNIDPAVCIGKTWDLVSYHMNRICFHCECYNSSLSSDNMTKADRLHRDRFHHGICSCAHSKCSNKSSHSRKRVKRLC